MSETNEHVTVTRAIDRAVDLWALARGLDDERIALLDNPGAPSRLGHWNYLGLFPEWEVVVRNGSVTAGPPGAATPVDAHPLDALGSAVIGRPARPPRPGEPPFTAGMIGYIAHELLHELETVERSRAPAPLGAEMHFVRFGAIVAVNTLTRSTYVSGTGRAPARTASRSAARQRMADAVALLEDAPDRVDLPYPPRDDRPFALADLRAAGIDTVTGPDRYIDLIADAQERIREGRIFELCLTQEFRTELAVDATDLYDALRTASPAPMSAFVRNGDFALLCSSPERFLSVAHDRWVETRPVKGTRPRSTDPAADRRLRDELAASAKDRAENVMIVDLARNDLGRVCETGSISVPELQLIESYATVHQMVSTVRGRLPRERTPIEVIRAAFPGGSVTGAPKIEATRLIAAMEYSQRGVFSGAIGWIDTHGALDLNIAIRTIVKQGAKTSFHTGGAITIDSDPVEEYAETMHKARAMVSAIEQVRGKEATREPWAESSPSGTGELPEFNAARGHPAPRARA